MNAHKRITQVRRELIKACAEQLAEADLRTEITRERAQSLLLGDEWYDRGGSGWNDALGLIQQAWVNDADPDFEAATLRVLKCAFDLFNANPPTCWAGGCTNEATVKMLVNPYERTLRCAEHTTL